MDALGPPDWAVTLMRVPLPEPVLASLLRHPGDVAWLEARFGGHIDLEREARKAARWLEHAPPSKRPKKDLYTFWLRWLEKTERDMAARAPEPGHEKLSAAAWIRRHGRRV
jgi:hypothetical protein